MFRGRWLMMVLVGLLIFAVVGGIGSAMQRNAWNEGYMMGRLAIGGQDGAPAPMQPYAYSYPRQGFGGGGFFGGLGFLLGLGLLLFLVSGFFRIWRWRAWAMQGGPGAMPGGSWRGPGHEAWRHFHGTRRGCWGDAAEKSADQPAAKPEANPKPAEANAER